jgi:galactokinase
VTLYERLVNAFHQCFGDVRPRVFRAPGRVNLIGEHTDYNDGFVLPMAIERAVWIAARPRPDRQVRLHALDFNQDDAFSLDSIERSEQASWSDNVRGVAWALEEAGYRLRGMDAVIAGDVPIGAGLSSSAALEVATAMALITLSEVEVDRARLALLCQRAENEFVGMRCGIMDQFVSALGRRSHALLIDCRSLKHRLVPIPAGVEVVIADTGKRRGLVDSEYNLRRAQCEEGVRLLRQVLPDVRALRDVSPADLARFADRLPPDVRRRCQHVVDENARVLEAVAALGAEDVLAFGALMNASHESLRDLYQVSCDELDAMVEVARGLKDCLGARMTGAGFGGCTVNLVRSKSVEEFCRRLAEGYQRWTGLEPAIYVSRPADGAGEVTAGTAGSSSPG